MATLLKVNCLHCDFRQSFVAHSNYAYRLEEPPDVYLWAQFAWCGNCRQVVQAERLLTASESDEEIAHRSNRRLRQDGERYRQTMASRQSPPRCLRCGGIDIIPAAGSWAEQAVTHPACGGIIRLERSGHVRLSDRTDVYSPEGERLTTVESILIPGRGY